MVNKFALSHLDRMIPKQEVRHENIKQNDDVTKATAAAFFCFLQHQQEQERKIKAVTKKK